MTHLVLRGFLTGISNETRRFYRDLRGLGVEREDANKMAFGYALAVDQDLSFELKEKSTS